MLVVDDNSLVHSQAVHVMITLSTFFSFLDNLFLEILFVLSLLTGSYLNEIFCSMYLSSDDT